MKRAAGVIVLAAALVWAHSADASDVADTVGVSVTVVRSCSVQAHAVDSNASSIRLLCSSATRGSNVLLGAGPRGGRLAAPTGTFEVDTPAASQSSGPPVREITLNF